MVHASQLRKATELPISAKQLSLVYRWRAQPASPAGEDKMPEKLARECQILSFSRIGRCSRETALQNCERAER